MRETKQRQGKTIVEPQRTLPVVWEGDVLVAGGGTAGVVAALASARAGATTLLIERYGCLGGNVTLGMMPWPYGLNDGAKIIIPGIPVEIMENIKKANGLVGDMVENEIVLLDPEIVKYVLNEMVEKEDRLKLLLDTWVADTITGDNGMSGVICENKSGRQAMLALIVVDTTGDADVVARAGGRWEIEERNDLHPVTLVGKMVNVDIDRMAKATKHLPSFPGLLKRGKGWRGVVRWKPLLEHKEKVPAELEYLTDWFCHLGQTARNGEIIVNITGATNVDATNGEEITNAEILSRKRLMQVVSLLQQYVPGFESAHLTATACALGVRESRRIIGEYTLTLEDSLGAKKFSDAIARGSVPPGFHTGDGTGIKKLKDFPSGTTFDIPYRCLLPQGTERLIVGGRCISAESKGVLGTVRVIGTAMATGAAAGVAAAMAAQEKIGLRKVDVTRLQRSLSLTD